jgi:asparagine synthase (glutamine-hydrolysing)
MSVHFGECNLDGKPVDPEVLNQVRGTLAPYGPDGEDSLCSGNLALLHRAFHTTMQSRGEVQPWVSDSGVVITWDGRIDNREELLGLLGLEGAKCFTDLAIVAKAYQTWKTGAFAKWIGDWAVSIWDPMIRCLFLAKDVVGTRHLYYSVLQEKVRWCSILDPLVAFASRLELETEYIAGWLASFPATHLTPYVGIHAVPPSSFIRLAEGNRTTTKYWDFNPAKTTRYGADSSYEEHFRTAFATAVRRRLRCDSPILAELSGGMDSSAIVCVADELDTRGLAETPRIDTVSYYDNSEPHWSERPYFEKVEAKRGRTGTHIDVGRNEAATCEVGIQNFAVTPASSGPLMDKAGRQFANCIASQGNRVLLSGIGGDEVAGGVPTPIPELQDLLVAGDLVKLARQLKVWSLNRRKPWFRLLFEAAIGFLPPLLTGVPEHVRPARWLEPAFVKQNRAALMGYPIRQRLIGPLPSFQENMMTLEALRRQLGASPLPSCAYRENRYPFLDRDLLEFLYSIPREQLVRPGQRRSLMRRSLIGIVPDEVLNRRRKAFVARSSMMMIGAESRNLTAKGRSMVSSSLGIVNAGEFRAALEMVSQGREVRLVTMMRAFAVELWLHDFKGVAIQGTSKSPSTVVLNVGG